MAKKKPTKSSDDDTDVRTQLRIPKEIADEMTEVIDSRLIRISRNSWILEAIYEKIQREK